MRPTSSPKLRDEQDRLEAMRHNHGRMYRCKIVPSSGPPQFGEWFASESDLNESRRSLGRKLGERYYCETKKITCAECEVDEPPKVISVL